MLEEEEYIGEVIWFRADWGYGFIHWVKDGVIQKDIFAHFSDINFEGFKLLKAGQKVSFSIGINHDNEKKAINIKVIENE